MLSFNVSTSDLLLSEAYGLCDSTDERYERLNLEVYSDEIFEVIDPRDHSKWVYIGVLFIPLNEKESCLQILKNYRCLKYEDWSDAEHECSHTCGFHDKNNTEVHYKEIQKSRVRFEIACRWIKFISADACTRINKKVYFNILGINLTNLKLDQFGSDSDRILTIYNRFYRTALLSGLKYFFKNYKVIVIHKVYHDNGSQKNHKYCPWHSIHKINIQYEEFLILDDEIEYIDSDHRKSNQDESQFIQLIDILLGATYSCLHNDSKLYEKKKIGYLFRSTLETLLDRRKHESRDLMIGRYYNSKYYRTYQVTFFPREIMEVQELQRRFDLDNLSEIPSLETDYFYYDRPIVVNDPDQSDLSTWL